MATTHRTAHRVLEVWVPVLVAALTLVTGLLVQSVPASAQQASPAIRGYQPPSALPNEAFEVWVSGFQPGERVEVRFGGGVVGVDVADANGEALVSSVVPDQMPPGDHPLDVSGDQGSSTGGTYTVDAPPPCDPSQSVLTRVTDRGRDGDPLEVEGHACAFERVEVWFGGSLVASTQADGLGGFVAAGRIPAGIPAGSHPLDVHGSGGTVLGDSVTVDGPVPGRSGGSASGSAAPKRPASGTRAPATTTSSTSVPPARATSGDGRTPSDDEDPQRISAGESVAAAPADDAQERDGIVTSWLLVLVVALVVVGLTLWLVLRAEHRRDA